MCVRDIDKPTLAITQRHKDWSWAGIVPDGVVLVKPCHKSVDHLWYTAPLGGRWRRCHRNSHKATVMLKPLKRKG